MDKLMQKNEIGPLSYTTQKLTWKGLKASTEDLIA